MKENQTLATISTEFYYCRVCKKNWGTSQLPKAQRSALPGVVQTWDIKTCIYCFSQAAEIAQSCRRCEVYYGTSKIEDGVCSDCRWQDYHAQKPQPDEAIRIRGHAYNLALRGHNNKNISIDLSEQHPSFQKLTPNILKTIDEARHHTILNCLRTLSPRADDPYSLPRPAEYITNAIYLLERIEQLQGETNST